MNWNLWWQIKGPDLIISGVIFGILIIATFVCWVISRIKKGR